MTKKKTKINEFKESVRSFLRFDDIGLSLMFIIPGLIGTMISLSRMEYADKSEDWSRADGKIISTDLHRKSSGTKIRGYEPKIVYEYTVKYVNYRSSKRSYGYTSFENNSEALAILDKYKPGQMVTVYYKPDNPEIAVLETGRGEEGIPTPLIVAIPFASLGSLLFVIAVFNRLKRLVTKK